jgi:hypothetical protein
MPATCLFRRLISGNGEPIVSQTWARRLRIPDFIYLTSINAMPKHKEEKPLAVRCPNCKQVREPDYNETTRRYVCSICSEPVDAQVFIEKKKRGLK